MSTAAANPKGDRIYLPGQTPLDWAKTYLGTTVGQKVVTALTGLGLTGFVVFHMVGNLKLLPGGPAAQEAINGYADFLKHDLGALLWVARAGLLALFVTHILLTVRLHAKSAAARAGGFGYPRYAVHRYAQATLASRSMLLTGVVVGAFTAFHVAHYTFGAVKDAVPEVPVPVADHATGGVRTAQPGERVNYLDLRDSKGRHDVYSMTIAGFRNPWVSGLYLVAQVALAFHLSHGVKSSLQTLGLVGRRFSRAAFWLGVGVAGLVLVGNCAMVVAIWTGAVAPVYPAVAK